jgi:hypothetical protein
MNYQYLTTSIKRRMLEDLKRHFSYIPQHKDIVEHIRYKYDFKERPQKGIFLMNVSATPMKLSTDNYMAGLHSYVMLGKLDLGTSRPSGMFVDWVKEDTELIERNKGIPPAFAGQYNLEIQSRIDPSTKETEWDLYVDPIYKVLQEPLLTFVTGNETSANLQNIPVYPNSPRLYLNGRTQLLSGPVFSLQANQSLIIHDPLFGLPQGQIRVRALSPQMAPYTIVAGVNDVLAFEVNGTPVTVLLPPGVYTAQQMKQEIDAAAHAESLFAPEYITNVVGDQLEITGITSVFFEDHIFSPASPTLGFPSASFIPPIAQGVLFRPRVLDHQNVMTLILDGIEYAIIFEPGMYKDAVEIRDRIQDQLPVGVTLVLQDGGEYTVDNVTGAVTFHVAFSPGDHVIADYSYHGPSRGPIAVKKNQEVRHAVEGAMIALGESFEDKDKCFILILPHRVHTADLYGGKTEISLDFDIIARDPMDRESLVDILTMYFHHYENERFAEEGLGITSVSGGGESEEVYDDVGDDYFYKSSVSVSLQSDWEVAVPRPLTIEKILPVTYEQEALLAARERDILPHDQVLRPVVSVTQEEIKEKARRGLTPFKERIH